MRVFLSSLSIFFVHSCLYTPRTTKSLALPPYLLPSLALPVSPACPRCPLLAPSHPPLPPLPLLPCLPSFARSIPRLLCSLTLKGRSLCRPPTAQSSHGQRISWTSHDRPTALLEQPPSATPLPTNHCPAQSRISPNRPLLHTGTIYPHPPS